MKLGEKTQKTLWGVFAVVFIVVFAAWMILKPAPEHIEDTNGAENYSLQSITENDIVSAEMGSRGGISQRESKLQMSGVGVSNGIRYSAKKFTGVHRLYTCQVFKGSDIVINLSDFKINSGNFAFCVVLDGKIVGQLEPDEFGMVEFCIEDIDKTATLEYILAGESANFSFKAPTDW